VVRQHFQVDGQEGIPNPVGMLGARIGVDIHVVHGNFNRLQNPIRAVKALQLEVENIVFNGLASSLAMLTNEQKEMGALVIDIGGGTTEYVLCLDGLVKHTGLLAVGGDHIANDLAYGLKVPLSRAERLKIEHGSAVMDDSVAGQTVTLENESGLGATSLNLEHLRRIMAARVREILELIALELEGTGLFSRLRAGVVLCGGGARISRITELSEKIFGLPTSVGRAASVSGMTSALDQPEFATAIGLVKFGSFQARQRIQRGALTEGLRNRFGRLLRSVKG
jgi:cell division protein FtsA